MSVASGCLRVFVEAALYPPPTGLRVDSSPCPFTPRVWSHVCRPCSSGPAKRWPRPQGLSLRGEWGGIRHRFGCPPPLVRKTDDGFGHPTLCLLCGGPAGDSSSPEGYRLGYTLRFTSTQPLALPTHRMWREMAFGLGSEIEQGKLANKARDKAYAGSAVLLDLSLELGSIGGVWFARYLRARCWVQSRGVADPPYEDVPT